VKTPGARIGVRALAIVAAAIVAVAAAGAWFATREPPPAARRADAARLMAELMSGKVPVGAEFVLADPEGQRVALADFRGKLVLLYFGYATCPDVCPTDLATIGQTLRDLGDAGEQVQPVFVTLDPERDTPAVLREYAAAFHPRFVALTGTEREIRRVATDFKVYFERVPLPGTTTYVIDHTAYTFLLDREGRFISLFPPGTPSARVATLLREQLAAPRP
jgi:protein SCO1/2